MKFEMAEIKIEKFEIMDVITTSGDECDEHCEGYECDEI